MSAELLEGVVEDEVGDLRPVPPPGALVELEALAGKDATRVGLAPRLARSS
ncbi:MAG: hypothetical protein M3065_11330 [Actinomycetota bacterium]|nr:hypothetical protein [Actinomycetota bacterium]